MKLTKEEQEVYDRVKNGEYIYAYYDVTICLKLEKKGVVINRETRNATPHDNIQQPYFYCIAKKNVKKEEC